MKKIIFLTVILGLFSITGASADTLTITPSSTSQSYPSSSTNLSSSVTGTIQYVGGFLSVTPGTLTINPSYGTISIGDYSGSSYGGFVGVVTGLTYTSASVTSSSINGQITQTLSPSSGSIVIPLNQLTGEAHADLGTISLETVSAFNQTILGRLDERQGLHPEQTAGLPSTFQVAQLETDDMGPLYGPGNGPHDLSNDKIQPWIRGYGNFGHAGGTGGTSDYGYSDGGVIAGADAKVTDTTLVGGAVAYDHANFNSDPLNDNGNIDSYHIAVYGTQKIDLPYVNSLLLDASAAYAYSYYQDQRAITVPGISSVSASHHNGNDYSIAGGISKPVDFNGPVGKITVLPRAGIEYDDIEQNAYHETGSGPLSLNTNSTSLDALRSILGAKAAETFHTEGGTGLTPELRASWLHDFKDITSPTTVVFEGAPNVPFQVTGVNIGRDAAIVGTGLTVAFQHGINTFVDYDATVRSNELDHTVSAGVRYRW